MTPAEMLEAAMEGKLELDGEQQPDPAPQGGEATAKTEQVEQKQPEQTTEEPEGAPIASKSGTYTIPYEKLKTARDQVQSLTGENEALKQQLAELTAKQQANIAEQQESAQARADAGQKQTQADKNLEAAQAAISEGVDASIFGDFSEDALAKGIKSLVAQEREAIRAELKAEIERDLAQVKAKQAKDQQDSHYGAIYAKHPDADELVQSEQFAKWHESLPTFVRDGVQQALKGGSTAQVIEVFDTFKAQTGKAAAPNAQDKAKAPEVKKHVPNSLSEIAGEQHRDVVQQAMETADNPAALLASMETMTPAQIERLMNAVPG